MRGALSESASVRKQQDSLETEVSNIRALLDAKESSAMMAVTTLSAKDARLRSHTYRDAIKMAQPKMQRRYIRAFVRSVSVCADKVSLCGTGDGLADLVCNPTRGKELISSPVHSSIREWRSGRESN